MCADFAPFFQNVNIFGGEFRFCAARVVRFDEIRQVQCTGKSGRTGANDEDVGFELFALNGHSAILPIRKSISRQYPAYLAFCSSSVSAGMISNMSPTTP